MSYVTRHTVSVTTDAGGDATAYTPTVNGRVLTVIYTKDDFANGVDFTITTESTAQSVWVESDVNASATVAPRQPTHAAADGSASLYAGSGEPVETYVWTANERVKIVIGSGGNATSGTFDVLIG